MRNAIDPTMLRRCTPSTCPLDTSLYGYRPSIPANAVFIAAALLCATALAWASVRSRRGAAPSLLGCLADALLVLGYADRIVGWVDPWDVFPWAQGTALLGVAPLLMSSSYYTTLPSIIRTLGKEHALVSPRLLTPLLLLNNLVALVLQVVGYDMALPSTTPFPTRIPSETVKSTTGADIAMAGSALHIATLTAALALHAPLLVRASAAEAKYGYTTFHEGRGYVPLARLFRYAAYVLFPLGLAALVGREIYRIAALAGGLRGVMYRSESVFLGVEGVLVAVAMVMGVLCHPGWTSGAIRGLGETEGALPTIKESEREGELEEVSRVYREQEDILRRSLSAVSTHTEVVVSPVSPV